VFATLQVVDPVGHGTWLFGGHGVTSIRERVGRARRMTAIVLKSVSRVEIGVREEWHVLWP
jgi:hypothetical protein